MVGFCFLLFAFCFLLFSLFPFFYFSFSFSFFFFFGFLGGGDFADDFFQKGFLVWSIGGGGLE